MIYTDCSSCNGLGFIFYPPTIPGGDGETFRCDMCSGRGVVPADLAGMRDDLAKAIWNHLPWAEASDGFTLKQTYHIVDAVIACLTADCSPASKGKTT